MSASHFVKLTLPESLQDDSDAVYHRPPKNAAAKGSYSTVLSTLKKKGTLDEAARAASCGGENPDSSSVPESSTISLPHVSALGYAARLSENPNKGPVGAPELTEKDAAAAEKKLQQFLNLIVEEIRSELQHRPQVQHQQQRNVQNLTSKRCGDTLTSTHKEFYGGEGSANTSQCFRCVCGFCCGEKETLESSCYYGGNQRADVSFSEKTHIESNPSAAPSGEVSVKRSSRIAKVENSVLCQRQHANKCRRKMWKPDTSGGICVHTGAGISTSAGILDFRGPSGVWTLEAAGQDLSEKARDAVQVNFGRHRRRVVDFHLALPTPTHLLLRVLATRPASFWQLTHAVSALNSDHASACVIDSASASGAPPHRTLLTCEEQKQQLQSAGSFTPFFENRSQNVISSSPLLPRQQQHSAEKFSICQSVQQDHHSPSIIQPTNLPFCKQQQQQFSASSSSSNRQHQQETACLSCSLYSQQQPQQQLIIGNFEGSSAASVAKKFLQNEPHVACVRNCNQVANCAIANMCTCSTSTLPTKKCSAVNIASLTVFGSGDAVPTCPHSPSAEFSRKSLILLKEGNSSVAAPATQMCSVADSSHQIPVAAAADTVVAAAALSPAVNRVGSSFDCSRLGKATSLQSKELAVNWKRGRAAEEVHKAPTAAVENDASCIYGTNAATVREGMLQADVPEASSRLPQRAAAICNTPSYAVAGVVCSDESHTGAVANNSSARTDASHVVKYIITQNVDGLHARCGTPFSILGEVHGSMFVERCETCGRRYFRDFPLPTLSFQPTGHLCGLCCFPPTGVCTDVLLDWFDPYEKFLNEQSRKHAKNAGVHVCMGTSLQIEPACHLPSKGIRRRDSKLVIVNLQETPLDAEATVCLRLPTDEVAEKLAAGLRLFDCSAVGASAQQLLLQHTRARQPWLATRTRTDATAPTAAAAAVTAPAVDEAADFASVTTKAAAAAAVDTPAETTAKKTALEVQSAVDVRITATLTKEEAAEAVAGSTAATVKRGGFAATAEPHHAKGQAAGEEDAKVRKVNAVAAVVVTGLEDARTIGKFATDLQDAPALHDDGMTGAAATAAPQITETIHAETSGAIGVLKHSPSTTALTKDDSGSASPAAAPPPPATDGTSSSATAAEWQAAAAPAAPRAPAASPRAATTSLGNAAASSVTVETPHTPVTTPEYSKWNRSDFKGKPKKLAGWRWGREGGRWGEFGRESAGESDEELGAPATADRSDGEYISNVVPDACSKGCGNLPSSMDSKDTSHVVSDQSKSRNTVERNKVVQQRKPGCTVGSFIRTSLVFVLRVPLHAVPASAVRIAPPPSNGVSETSPWKLKKKMKTYKSTHKETYQKSSRESDDSANQYTNTPITAGSGSKCGCHSRSGSNARSGCNARSGSSRKSSSGSGSGSRDSFTCVSGGRRRGTSRASCETAVNARGSQRVRNNDVSGRHRSSMKREKAGFPQISKEGECGKTKVRIPESCKEVRDIKCQLSSYDKARFFHSKEQYADSVRDTAAALNAEDVPQWTHTVSAELREWLSEYSSSPTEGIMRREEIWLEGSPAGKIDMTGTNTRNKLRAEPAAQFGHASSSAAADCRTIGLVKKKGSIEKSSRNERDDHCSKQQNGSDATVKDMQYSSCCSSREYERTSKISTQNTTRKLQRCARQRFLLRISCCLKVEEPAVSEERSAGVKTVEEQFLSCSVSLSFAAVITHVDPLRGLWTVDICRDTLLVLDLWYGTKAEIRLFYAPCSAGAEVDVWQYQLAATPNTPAASLPPSPLMEKIYSRQCCMYSEPREQLRRKSYTVCVRSEDKPTSIRCAGGYASSTSTAAESTFEPSKMTLHDYNSVKSCSSIGGVSKSLSSVVKCARHRKLSVDDSQPNVSASDNVRLSVAAAETVRNCNSRITNSQHSAWSDKFCGVSTLSGFNSHLSSSCFPAIENFTAGIAGDTSSISVSKHTECFCSSPTNPNQFFVAAGERQHYPTFVDEKITSDERIDTGISCRNKVGIGQTESEAAGACEDIRPSLALEHDFNISKNCTDQCGIRITSQSLVSLLDGGSNTANQLSTKTCRIANVPHVRGLVSSMPSSSIRIAFPFAPIMEKSRALPPRQSRLVCCIACESGYPSRHEIRCGCGQENTGSDYVSLHEKPHNDNGGDAESETSPHDKTCPSILSQDHHSLSASSGRRAVFEWKKVALPRSFESLYKLHAATALRSFTCCCDAAAHIIEQQQQQQKQIITSNLAAVAEIQQQQHHQRAPTLKVNPKTEGATGTDNKAGHLYKKQHARGVVYSTVIPEDRSQIDKTVSRDKRTAFKSTSSSTLTNLPYLPDKSADSPPTEQSRNQRLSLATSSSAGTPEFAYVAHSKLNTVAHVSSSAVDSDSLACLQNGFRVPGPLGSPYTVYGATPHPLPFENLSGSRSPTLPLPIARSHDGETTQLNACKKNKVHSFAISRCPSFSQQPSLSDSTRKRNRSAKFQLGPEHFQLMLPSRQTKLNSALGMPFLPLVPRWAVAFEFCCTCEENDKSHDTGRSAPVPKMLDNNSVKRGFKGDTSNMSYDRLSSNSWLHEADTRGVSKKSCFCEKTIPNAGDCKKNANDRAIDCQGKQTINLHCEESDVTGHGSQRSMSGRRRCMWHVRPAMYICADWKLGELVDAVPSWIIPTRNWIIKSSYEVLCINEHAKRQEEVSNTAVGRAKNIKNLGEARSGSQRQESSHFCQPSEIWENAFVRLMSAATKPCTHALCSPSSLDDPPNRSKACAVSLQSKGKTMHIRAPRGSISCSMRQKHMFSSVLDCSATFSHMSSHDSAEATTCTDTSASCCRGILVDVQVWQALRLLPMWMLTHCIDKLECV